MKKTLNTKQVADAIHNDNNSHFSEHGALALAKYLEYLEEMRIVLKKEKEKELNLEEIRKRYTEYPTARDALRDFFGFDLHGIEDEKDAINFLKIRTDLLQFDNGIIIENL